MGILRCLQRRNATINRMVQELKGFRALVSNKQYKETLLCQIQNQSVKGAKFILGWWVIYHRLIAGMAARKVSLMIGRCLTLSSMKKFLQQLDEFVNGKKTYLAGLCLAIYGVVKAFGVEITPEQDMAIIALLGALLSVGLGHKLDKIK